MAITVMRAGNVISASMVRREFLVIPLRCDNAIRHRYRSTGTGRRAMPAIEDDDRPKKKIAHEIGQDLTLLSVGELTERIALLKEEIARLEANMSSKRASKSAADLFFKK
jgi:uncharacterized small protein (DUF1192 family)